MKLKGYKLTELVLDCLFPPLCLACRKNINSPKEKSFNLCASCQNKIYTHDHVFCSECGNRLPLPSPMAYGLKPKSVLRSLCHSNTPPLLATASYENQVIRELIHSLKYQSLESAAVPIKELVIKPYIKKIFGHSSLVISHCMLVPIPLHKSKERKRGFNQSKLITRALAECLDEISSIPNSNFQPATQNIEPGPHSLKPVTCNLLTRVRPTRTQTEMKDKKSRAENVRDCFAISPSALPTVNLQLSTIILVDDVSTSGATLKEAARVLRLNGFRKIILFALAKT